MIPAAGVRVGILLVLAASFGCRDSSPVVKSRHVVAVDPLPGELARWSAFAPSGADEADRWGDVVERGRKEIAGARAALARGDRYAALLRLSRGRMSLAAVSYVTSRPAGKLEDLSIFETEWRRVGKATGLGEAVRPARFAETSPAAARALAEVSASQAAAFYAASLDYGRSTMPGSGFYYLGAAQAQREFGEFCLRLPAERRVQPELRSFEPDIAAVQKELLAAYRPPMSVDRHSDFIAANASLKEARELERAGLRHGALLRYLQAVQRTAAITGVKQLSAEELSAATSEAARRLASPTVDRTIGELFLQLAKVDVAEAVAGQPATEASAILTRVIPAYFRALEPVKSQPERISPQVSVTLVRWPFT